MPPEAKPDPDAGRDCPDQIQIEVISLEQVMSGLALAFLVLAALALRQIERAPEHTEASRLLGGTMLALWVALGLDALVGFWRRRVFSWPAVQRLLLLSLIPPFRIAQSPYSAGSCIWLPGLGWRRADQDLYERVERAFAIPMLVMAILILPILAAELFLAKALAEHPGVRLALDLGTALIWLAFCVELIVMSTLASKKLPYLARNWINLAIVVLPFLAFLRGLKAGRALWLGKGLGKAAKTLKAYRLRGLWMRGWRGMVALDLMERLLHRTPERRLTRLREILAERERDMASLRRRIEDLEAELDPGSARAEDTE